jgi:hypothetical protein
MKTGLFKNMIKNRLVIHVLWYIIILLFLILLIPAIPVVAKNDQSVPYELFRLYIYPAAVAFWWKWIA